MLLPASLQGSGDIDFNRDIRPILSDKCYACHGPDENARQADLRLDVAESAFEDRGGYAAVTPGDAAASEALARIAESDPEMRMPPPDSNLELSEEEIERIRQWVIAGAPWQAHWAFVRPEKAPIPDAVGGWSRNTIDRFVFDRLRSQQLRPAPEADKATLLRRLYLDLTGLPPTPEQVDAFVQDESPAAYDRIVDRLLASEAAAERLALDWLDVARYADSHGLHADGARTTWPYRDWVIDAFRQNMPYDQFVTWQLAGDLLPHASHDQRLATAFLRNHPMTAEGGVIDEEFRMNYVFDRLETTATAFLGLTMGCARCHDHKFDPLSQREHYQLSAFFNNVRELGMTGDDGDYGPLLPLPTSEQVETLAARDAELRAAADALEAARRAAQAEFKRLAETDQDPARFDVALPPESAGVRFTLDDVGNDQRVTINVAPETIAGIDGNAAYVDGEYGHFGLNEVGLIEVGQPLSAALWIRPDPRHDAATPKTRVLMGTTGNKNQFWRGWEIYLDEDDRLAVRLIHNPPDNLIHVRTTAKIEDQRWTHIAFAYDGRASASGIQIYIDGQAADSVALDDSLTRTILPAKAAPEYPPDKERAIRVGRSYRAFTGDFGIYHGAIDDIRIYNLALTQAEADVLFASYGSSTPGIDQVTEVSDRTSDAVFEHWLRRSYEPWEKADAQYRDALQRRVDSNSKITSIMVIAETDEPRPAYVLQRGEYSRPQEQVSYGTPEAVLPWSKDWPQNRLGLAQWLFDKNNPLTARVAVNRYWQMLFRHGLVRTPHDFGIQGERPTHPELLDWLAIEFRESGWDVRKLLKLIVASAVYRQSSSIAEWRAAPGQAGLADPLSVDPENRLLWRAPSFRLPAEIIRDRALAASGLLVRKVGGPSVKPYQPPGLWKDKNNFSQELKEYQHDSGESLYRRSMYTFIRRTSPPPAMIMFDAPSRETCMVKREVTNTPLQALVLLNDPQFVEAARVLAQRALASNPGSTSDQIDTVFRMLIGRKAHDRERDDLVQLYESSKSEYAESIDAANSLLEIGEYPLPEDLDMVDCAALTIVANAVMSFDEFYMRR